MKNFFIIRSTLFVAVTSLFLFSCSSSDEIVNNGSEEKSVIEKMLVTNSEQTVDFQINYGMESEYRVIFDVYSENPFVSNTGSYPKPFMSAMTGENGEYKFSRIIPGGIKEVYITSNCEGVPVLYGKIINGVVKPEECNTSVSRAGNDSENLNSIPVTNNHIVKDYGMAVRPLSDIIDDVERDDVLDNMMTYTKSNFKIVNGMVTGVTDEIYVGSLHNIGKIVFTDFQSALQSILNSLFVYNDNYFSRAKVKGVVRTTVKEMGVEIQQSRSAVNLWNNLTPEEIIRNLIYSKKDALKNGTYLKLNMYVEFEPVSYSEFITTIPLPPYTPFIENN